MTKYDAGAERAGEEAGGAGALLSTAAEEALQAAVYEGATFSSHKGGPAEVLMGLLQQPFLELKVAAYRQAHCQIINFHASMQLAYVVWWHCRLSESMSSIRKHAMVVVQLI